MIEETTTTTEVERILKYSEMAAINEFIKELGEHKFLVYNWMPRKLHDGNSWTNSQHPRRKIGPGELVTTSSKVGPDDRMISVEPQ